MPLQFAETISVVGADNVVREVPMHPDGTLVDVLPTGEDEAESLNSFDLGVEGEGLFQDAVSSHDWGMMDVL